MNVMAIATLDSGGNGEPRLGIWGEKESDLKSEDGARSEALTIHHIVNVIDGTCPEIVP